MSEGRCDVERTPLECTSVDCTKAHREPSPRPAGTTLGLASRAGSDAATNSGKPAGAAQGRSPLRPEDESSAKQPPVDDPTPPDPGGAQSSPAGIPFLSTPVATSSSAFDTSGENATVDTLRVKSLALKAAERDGLRMAASNLLARAGVTFVVLEARSCAGGLYARFQPRRTRCQRQSRREMSNHSHAGKSVLKPQPQGCMEDKS